MILHTKDLEGKTIHYEDGGWFYYYTQEEKDEVMKDYLSKSPNGMFGPPIGYGELICTAE